MKMRLNNYSQNYTHNTHKNTHIHIKSKQPTKGNRRKSAGGENVLSDLWEAREAYHISRQGGGQSMKRVSYFTCCSCYFPYTRLPSPKRPSELQPSISEVTLRVKMNGTPGEVIYFFFNKTHRRAFVLNNFYDCSSPEKVHF